MKTRKWIAISTRTQLIEVPAELPDDEQKGIVIREAMELSETEWDTFDMTAVPENRIIIRSREIREGQEADAASR